MSSCPFFRGCKKKKSPAEDHPETVGAARVTQCNSHSFSKHAVRVCWPEALDENTAGNR